MNKTLKRKVMVHLRKLGNRKIKPESTPMGICHELDTQLGVPYNWVKGELRTIMATWSKYSGNLVMPVPHPKLDEAKAFCDATNLWDARTTYGKDRLELCLFIADELEKELKEDESNN